MHEQENYKKQNFSELHHLPQVCLFADGMTSPALHYHGIFLKRVRLRLKHLQYKKSWCRHQVVLYVDSQTISCFISLFRRTIISRWGKNLG